MKEYPYRTEVRESSIKGAGRGVFAAEAVPKGATVLSDHCYPLDLSPGLFPTHKASGVYWLAFNDRHQPDKWLIALGRMSLMNHSETPTVQVVQEGLTLSAVAVRDLHPGDELVYPYYNRDEYDFS